MKDFTDEFERDDGASVRVIWRWRYAARSRVTALKSAALGVGRYGLPGQGRGMSRRVQIVQVLSDDGPVSLKTYELARFTLQVSPSRNVVDEGIDEIGFSGARSW